MPVRVTVFRIPNRMIVLYRFVGVLMNKIVVYGSARLSGEVQVGGSKNAALPILFATLTTGGVSKIANLPDIGDVRVALELLRDLGVRVERREDAVYIDSRGLQYRPPRADLVSKIRASTYLIGGCLSRFGICDVGSFGGCNFASRPIDLHIYAAERLGARLDSGRIRAARLMGSVIDFPKPSVGATVNAILMAASAAGETVIHGFAREPHIDSLIEFLISAGADIRQTDGEIRIVGKPLRGGEICVVGDMIEAGSYLTAGIITGGEVAVSGCPASHLESLLDVFHRFGAEVEAREDFIVAHRGRECHRTSVTASPYPGFPTDLQPIIAPLLASGLGGCIKDTVWSTRFGYLDQLRRFGVRSRTSDGEAIIAPSHFVPAIAEAPDLRGGMACLLAALSADGVSVIYSPEVILRGYENLCEKLGTLGARVEIS